MISHFPEFNKLSASRACRLKYSFALQHISHLLLQEKTQGYSDRQPYTYVNNILYSKMFVFIYSFRYAYYTAYHKETTHIHTCILTDTMQQNCFYKHTVHFHNTVCTHCTKHRKMLTNAKHTLIVHSNTRNLNSHKCITYGTQTNIQLFPLHIPRVLSYVFVLFVENGNFNQCNRKFPLNEASHFH